MKNIKHNINDHIQPAPAYANAGQGALSNIRNQDYRTDDNERETYVVPSWRDCFNVVWSLYLPIRLLLSLWIAILAAFGPFRTTAHDIGGWLWKLLLEPWYEWDVLRYVDIARDGYGINDGRAAYHPLLPFLMRGIGDILGGQY
ncbi:MAG TPA: hypothetical protein VFQ23_17615, partial [Anaerolineales bacterium]|nr:hypothetical protein [Anaerolineales bacterium]